jgi:phosphoglucosamine mutase
MPPRFGTDGVRGVALTELTPSFVALVGRAAADVLGPGPWLIARDTRESGPTLSTSVAAGIRAAGGTVVDLGMMPTPALAHWAERLGRPAVMITASHNPWGDNGVKVFAAGGAKLRDDVERRIEAVIDAHHAADVQVADASMELAVSDGADRTDAATLDAATLDAATRYVDHLVDGVRSLAGLRIVLDVANGAMTEVAPIAFRRLGAEVTVINDRPDGRNINDRCGATHPESLREQVVATGADLGLAFDGDGDRVIAVDERGRVVDGDRLIALAALELRSHGALVEDTVVVTVMSNLGFHRAMRAEGIQVVTTAVGDRYVLEALDSGGWSIGGEQSGHIVFRGLATTGDGLLAGLRIAAHVLDQGRSLGDLADAVMTTFPQVLRNVRVAARHPDVATELADEIAAAEGDLGDDGRVLVRASGTEPLIRVMVEAATIEVAERVAAALVDVVERRFGGPSD